MSSLQPVEGYESKPVETENGKVYFYVGAQAGQAVAASMTHIQMVQSLKAQQQTQSLVAAARGGNEFLDPLTGIILGAASSIAGAAGVAGTAAAGAASVGNFATNVASVSLAYSQAKDATPLASAEIVVRNEMLGPLVPSGFKNDNCSTASGCTPILPGAATGVDIMQPNGFDDASVTLEFVAGAIGYASPDDGVQPATPTSASIRFDYNGDWVPSYSIDGSEFKSDSSNSLTALYFQPNENSPHGAFTIASTLVQKSTGAMTVSFLPGSAQLAA